MLPSRDRPGGKIIAACDYHEGVVFVGTAGWNIPRIHREQFAADGTQLRRYASRLNAAEINSSFYRPHQPAVYERWAASVPAAFRFAVKMPKAISHEQALARCRAPLDRFLDEVSVLGPKLGPLLLQLPPSFAFEARRVGRFLDLLRARHSGTVVCEPRHLTWVTPAAAVMLERFEVGRVAADPPRAAGLDSPGGWGGVIYYRWHGSPRPYFSPYDGERLGALAAVVRTSAVETWCIFDNTGSGAAAGNAVDLADRLQARGVVPSSAATGLASSVDAARARPRRSDRSARRPASR